MGKDLFNDVIKNKLENHSLPIDDASWNEIEKRLGQKKKINFLPWISAIAVAASIAILWMIFPFNKEISVSYENDLSENESPVKENVLEENGNLPVGLSGENALFASTVQGKQKQQPREEKLDTGDRDAIGLEEPEVFEENTPERRVEETEVFVAPDSRIIAETDHLVKPRIKRKKTSFRISISAGRDYAMVNDNPALGGNYAMKAEGPKLATSSSQSIQEDILSYKDFQDISHSAPLSFGLSVRRNINTTFAVETGINYTYLSSSFKNSTPKQEARLRLHYVGIPVNLITNLYDNPNWRVYLSAGFMIEKGVYADYSQKEFPEEGKVTETSVDHEINGVQCSVSIAPGIEYKLNRNYSLYLEPKAGYFFKNDQPTSIRTEHPLNIGVNAGVRFTL